MSPLQESLAIAAQPPGEEAWTALSGLVEAMGASGASERDLEALDGALSGWPDALRVASPCWIDRLAAGEAAPEVRVARAVALAYADLDEILSVTQAPGLEHVTHLSLAFTDLGEDGGPALIRHLDEASSLGGVTSLVLRDCHLGDAGAEALARSSLLERLTSLDLSSNELTSEGIAAIAQAPRARRLRRLSLEYNECSEGSAMALGASPHLASLEELVFDPGEYEGIKAYRHLARSPHLRPAIREPYKEHAHRLLLAHARRPSAECWRETLAPLLDAFDAADFEAGRLAQVAELLAAWPPGRRALAPEWLGRVLGREPVPQAQLADVLDVHLLRGLGRRAEDIDTLARLLDAPELAHVTALDLFCCVFPRHALRALFAHPSVERLRALSLAYVKVGPRLVEALARSPLGRSLESLSVSVGLEGLSALRAIFQSRLATRLTSLALPCNELGDRGAAALARQPGLARIGTLDLRSNGIGDAGAIAIARSPHARGLRSLLLAENAIGDEGAVAIAESPYLANLVKLELGHGDNHVGDAGAKAIARSATLGRLVELGLDFNRVGGQGALALVRSDRLTSLRRLNVCYGNEIDDESAIAMAEAASRVPDLRLNLGFGAHVGAPGCAALDRTTLVDPLDRRERQAMCAPDDEP